LGEAEAERAYRRDLVELVIAGQYSPAGNAARHAGQSEEMLDEEGQVEKISDSQK